MEEMALVPPKAKKERYCMRSEVVVTSTRFRSRLCSRWNCAEKMMRSGMLLARDWVMSTRTRRLWTVRIEPVDC